MAGFSGYSRFPKLAREAVGKQGNLQDQNARCAREILLSGLPIDSWIRFRGLDWLNRRNVGVSAINPWE
jgi:hypothetical protein